MPEEDRPKFSTWTRSDLEDWCEVAYTIVQRQQDALMAMQRELKDCQERRAMLHNQLTDDWK
jgi:hypothetical protein